MHDLLIAWPGGEARFSPDDSPVAVGRSADAAIVLTDPAISRRHLELVWLGSSWIANDSSTHGSFDPIGVRLAPTWTVGAEVTVRLGGVGGTEVRMALVDHLPRAEAPSETPADRPAAGAEPAPAGAQVAPAVQPAPPPHLEDPAGAAEQMPPGPAAGAGEPPPPDPGAHADGPPPPDSGAHADGPPPPDPGAHADGPPPPDPGAHADGPTPADPGVHGGDEPESWPGTAAPAPSPLSDSFPAAPAPVPPTPPPRPDDAPLEVAAASHQANGAESVAVAEQEVRGDAPPSPRDTQALAGRARSILEPAQQASPPAAERPPAGLRLGDPAAPAAAPDAPPPPSILAEPPAPAPQPPAPIDHQAPPAPEALVDNDPLAPPVPEPTAGPFDLQAPPAPEAPIDTDHQPPPAPEPPATPFDLQAPPAPEAPVDTDHQPPPAPEPPAGPFDLQAPPAPEAPIETDHPAPPAPEPSAEPFDRQAPLAPEALLETEAAGIPAARPGGQPPAPPAGDDPGSVSEPDAFELRADDNAPATEPIPGEPIGYEHEPATEPISGEPIGYEHEPAPDADRPTPSMSGPPPPLATDAGADTEAHGASTGGEPATAPSVFDELPPPEQDQLYHEHAQQPGVANPDLAAAPAAEAPGSADPAAASPPNGVTPDELLAEFEDGEQGGFDPDDTFSFRNAPDPESDGLPNPHAPLLGLEPPASTNGDAQHGPGPGPNGITPAAGPATDREQAPSIFGNAPRPELDPDALAPGGRRPPMPPADVDHDGFPITQAVPRIEPRDEPPLPDHDVGFDLPQPGPGQPDILEPDHAEASAAGAASAEAGSWDEFMSGQAADEWSGPATAADTIISDDTIQLAIDGQNYVFVPGVDVTIGRDPSCLVNLDERHALVSRHHLRIEHRDGNWWIEDHSSKGTYIDGRRISAHYKAEGAFLAHLGDDDAGTPMRIITAGEHKAPRSFNTLLVVAMAAVVLLAVAALAFVLLGSRNGGDETTVTAGSDVTVAAPVPGADLARAKQATVILLAEEGFGSGFFVTENLIVTNQHVAVLADELAVGVSRTVDEPAQAEFLAETVAVHPYLDIAVMKLTVDAADSPVSTSGLEPVPIGDSGGLTLGDEVYNTGFPQDLSPAGFDDMGDILLPAVSATSGEAANFSIWPGCSNPTRDEFIPTGSPPGVGCAPDGDITRAVVITTFSSGEGASGSPVFSGDAVVAVVFSGPEGNENAGRNIATAAFADWLDQVIAENG